MRPTWSAAGERSASPPPNPKRTHNYMFPVLFTTQNNTTQTDVLGPWPSHGGLFTLSARLVDGEGAGSTGDCSSAIPSSSGCEPGRGGERGRFGEAGGIEGGAAQGLGQGANPPL